MSTVEVVKQKEDIDSNYIMMKDSILLIIFAFWVFSCKSPEQSFKDEVTSSVKLYNDNLSKEINAEVKNFIINKIDTLNLSKEKEILLNYVSEEHLALGLRKNDAYNNLQKKTSLLKSSEDLNYKYGGYQNLVDLNRIEFNDASTEFNNVQYEESVLYNLIQKLKNEIKSNKNDKSIQAYRVKSSYDVKLSDGSVHHVNKYFILNRDKDVYDEENYILNLRSKYIK